MQWEAARDGPACPARSQVSEPSPHADASTADERTTMPRRRRPSGGGALSPHVELRTVEADGSPGAIAVVHVRCDLPRTSGRAAHEQDELAVVPPSRSPGIRTDDVPDVAI